MMPQLAGTLATLAMSAGGGLLAGAGLAQALAPIAVARKRRGIAMFAVGAGLAVWGFIAV